MEEALIKRVMPHSIEAEQSVIGAMLMDKDAILAASEMISGQDFYQNAYGVIFDSIVEMFNEGKQIDLVSLKERLKEKDVPPEIASLEFMRDILDIVSTSVNVRQHADQAQRADSEYLLRGKGAASGDFGKYGEIGL